MGLAVTIGIGAYDCNSRDDQSKDLQVQYENKTQEARFRVFDDCVKANNSPLECQASLK